MNSTRVLVLIFSFTVLQGCQTTKPACVIQQRQDSHIGDLQRQKDDTLCEIQLRQAALDHITAAVNASGTVGMNREVLGRKAEADLTEKITQLKLKVRDLDFQMAADALANLNNLRSQAKLALQQDSEIRKDPKDSAAQVGLISTFLRAVAGGQSTRERITSLDDEIMNLVRPVTGGHGTGERITKPEWEAATATCPCLAGIEPQFGADGYMTGATISQGQAVQMLRAMVNNAKAAESTYQQLKKPVDDQMQADMEAAGLGGSQTAETPTPTGANFNWDAYPVAH
jgi:hypothetical protein